MSKNKVSKTFTLENDTIKTIEKLMEEKNLSSYSSALERIVIEWSILNSFKNNISYSAGQFPKQPAEQKIEENKHTKVIGSIFDNMPE